MSAKQIGTKRGMLILPRIFFIHLRAESSEKSMIYGILCLILGILTSCLLVFQVYVLHSKKHNKDKLKLAQTTLKILHGWIAIEVALLVVSIVQSNIFLSLFFGTLLISFVALAISQNDRIKKYENKRNSF
jgi:uncharacterized paraquat-inducible protein A